jgi:hypothetical protein
MRPNIHYSDIKGSILIDDSSLVLILYEKKINRIITNLATPRICSKYQNGSQEPEKMLLLNNQEVLSKSTKLTLLFHHLKIIFDPPSTKKSNIFDESKITM